MPALSERPALALQARGLRKEYPGAAGPVVVLDGLDLELEAGGSIAILGPSGCGKSTLLHLLGTLEPCSGGALRIAGEDPQALSEAALARFRNRRIGFVFQEHHLLPQLSLRENVLLPALAWPDALDLGGEDLEGRAERLLHRVGLAERAAAPPSRLSGGERQRAAMVRALMLRPALLLCDEPTGSLDRRTAQEVAELLMEVNREEAATLVVVTHSAELARLCARRSEMVAGRLSA